MDLQARRFALGVLLTTALMPVAARAGASLPSDEGPIRPPPLAAVSADSEDLIALAKYRAPGGPEAASAAAPAKPPVFSDAAAAKVSATDGVDALPAKLASLGPNPFSDSDAAAADTMPSPPASPHQAAAKPTEIAQLELTIPPPVLGYQPPIEKPAAPAQDSLQLDIEQSMQAISAETAPMVQAGIVYRGRAGQSGLSSLNEFGVPIEGRYSPWLTGQLKVSVDPIYLDTGSVGASNLPVFGANEILNAKSLTMVTPSDQTAGGVLGKLGYTYGPYSAEIGESALGFPVVNWIGGVAYAPKLLNDQLALRFEGLRQPVTDSLLSYAGTRASLASANATTGGAFGTKGTWGGVVKTGGRISAFYDDQSIGAFGNIGIANLTGVNVPDNGTIDGLIGAYFRPYKSADDQVKVGVNLIYFGFDKNLGFYSFGQGGYFSPRNYEAVTFPVEYDGRAGRWSYLGAVGLGVQHFNQRSSPYFPNNPAAQQALVNAVGVSTANYAGDVSTGLAVDLRAQVEYALNDTLSIGAAGQFDNGHSYDEGVVKLYLRKTFSEPAPSGIFPKPPAAKP